MFVFISNYATMHVVEHIKHVSLPWPTVVAAQVYKRLARALRKLLDLEILALYPALNVLHIIDFPSNCAEDYFRPKSRVL